MSENDEWELKKFSEVQKGDVIEGSDGSEVVVSAAYDEHVPERMFELSDDRQHSIKASGNHLWYVETANDRASHRERLRFSKRALSGLDSGQVAVLLETVSKEEEVETRLIDLAVLLDTDNHPDRLKVLIRTAESIGHVAEENVVRRFLDENVPDIIDETIMSYDAKVFAQQLLSLTGLKKFRKLYPVKVGKVLNTVQLFELLQSDIKVEIPEIHSL